MAICSLMLMMMASKDRAKVLVASSCLPPVRLCCCDVDARSRVAFREITWLAHRVERMELELDAMRRLSFRLPSIATCSIIIAQSRAASR